MNKRICITLAGLIVAAGAVQAQRVEETDAAFTYNGTWTATNDPNASGGSFTTSNTAGNTVSFTVNGNNFVLYRKVEPNGGYASVTVDGKAFGQLSFYSVQAVSQVPAAIDKLGDGQHQIVLTVLQDMPQGSGGTSVYVDAMENPALATAGPSQAQQDAVTRTNFYRNLIGLPPASHNLALGLAAVAHSKYLDDVDFVSNGGSPHNETQGRSPFFTAVSPSDRAAYFGFTGGGGTEDANNTPDPVTFVDGWMDGVYHRQPFISYGLTEIGFGGLSKGSCIDFAAPVKKAAGPAATLITTFPADAQTDVWIGYGGGDGPNNLPAGNAYGFPISLLVSFPDNATPGTATAATTGSLTDAAGNILPVIIADSTTDNQISSYFMIPTQPLAVATTYTARMSGVDSLKNAFDKTWKFTTANANAIHSVRPVLGNTYIYSINWDMPTGGVASQLEYGPTNAYGSVIAGELFPGRQTTFRALLPGVLTTAGTLHYRITSKDAQGNVSYATPDHIITVDTAIPAATVGFLKVTPSANGAFMQWETAGPVTSTQVNYGVDTTYGATQMSRLFGGSTTSFYADIKNLKSGTTYHYQIVTTDTQGNTLTTPDATFIVP